MLPGRWQFWHDLCRRGATSLAKVGWSGADGVCAVTVPMVPIRASALAGPKRFFNIRSSSSRNGNSILLLIAEQKRGQQCIPTLEPSLSPSHENVLFVPSRNVLLTESGCGSGRTRSSDHDP